MTNISSIVKVVLLSQLSTKLSEGGVQASQCNPKIRFYLSNTHSIYYHEGTGLEYLIELPVELWALKFWKHTETDYGSTITNT